MTLINRQNIRHLSDCHILGQIGVLMGGASAEREVSLQSGEAVLSELKANGLDAVGIDIGKDPIAALEVSPCDFAFIALHGPGGEDGRIQALLEWKGIGYTGSGVAASALAMNKLRSKYVWCGLGLPTPEFIQLSESSDFNAVYDQLGHSFVKSVCEGSSLGMYRTTCAEELKTAYSAAREFGEAVMVEKEIQGREFTVTLLGEKTLPVIELKAGNTFYDYEAKYLSDDTQYLCPAPLDEKKSEELSQLAISAFQALGCTGWGRVDFMQDTHGKFYLLEANTVPGMTEHSLVPMAAKAYGLSFAELLMHIMVETCTK